MIDACASSLLRPISLMLLTTSALVLLACSPPEAAIMGYEYRPLAEGKLEPTMLWEGPRRR